MDLTPSVLLLGHRDDLPVRSADREVHPGFGAEAYLAELAVGPWFLLKTLRLPLSKGRAAVVVMCPREAHVGAMLDMDLVTANARGSGRFGSAYHCRVG